MSIIPLYEHRFLSLADLRTGHYALQQEFRRYRQSDGTIEPTARPLLGLRIREFLVRGRSSGALLEAPSERQAAQAWLEYWAGELYRLDKQASEPARLDAYSKSLVEDLRPKDCPYQGVHPFTQEDADLFFGRGTAVEELLEALRNERLLLVVGPSGSGKSSLIQAGLIPALLRGDLFEFSDWTKPVLMTPGTHPLRNLAQAVIGRPASGSWIRETVAAYLNGDTHLCSQLEPAGIVVVDQFEELFIHRTGDAVDERKEGPGGGALDSQQSFVAERDALLRNLLQLVRSPQRRDVVVLSMRSDFEGYLELLQPLISYLRPDPPEPPRNCIYRLLAMTEAELRDAILEPARITTRSRLKPRVDTRSPHGPGEVATRTSDPPAIGVQLDPQVVQDLIRDARSEPNGLALPLLQLALQKLFEERSGPFAITRSDYERLGRPRQILTTSLDACVKQLGENRRWARSVLLRLLRSSEGLQVGTRTSRKGLVEELVSGHPDEEPGAVRAALGTVVDALRRAGIIRLTVIPGLDPQETIEYIEIAHETLVRTWPMLAQWIDERQMALSKRRRFEAYVAEWKRLGGKGGFLRDAALSEAREWIETDEARDLGVHSELRQLVQESHEFQERQEREAQAQVERARTAERQARSAEQLAREQLGRAEAAERRATSVRLATQAHLTARTQIDLALLLALEAFEVSDTPEARDALLELVGSHPHLVTYLREHRDMVYSVAFSPSGDRLASAEYNGAILLWDVHEARCLGRLYEGDDHEIDCLTFHPDGQRIVAASRGGEIRLWDTATQTVAARFGQAIEAVNAVAFSPNGRHLASAGSDQLVRLWELETGQELHRFPGHSGSVLSVVFSPDGERLASAGRDRQIFVWDLLHPRRDGKLIGIHKDNAACLAFHPDGRHLASGSRDRTVRLWDSERGRELAVLEGHTALVWSVAFSPDGRTLASASRDRTVILWDFERARLTTRLTAHRDEVNAVAFSPVDRVLVTASDDRTLALWDLSQLPERLPQSGEVGQLDFSPNGALLAVGCRDGRVALYDVAGPERKFRTPLTGHQGEVLAVAFAPASDVLATGGVDRFVRLWDVQRGELLTPPLDGHKDEIYSLAFSPRNNLLASGARDGQVILWSAASGQLIQRLPGGRGGVICVAFDPRGERLACGGEDGRILVWDLTVDPIAPVLRITHPDQINCLVFHPHADLLAFGSDDTSVVLVDLADAEGAPLYDLQNEDLPGLQGTVRDLREGHRRTVLHGHSALVWDLALSADGRWLASGGRDDRVMLWDLSAASPSGRALAGHTGAVTTVAFHPNHGLLASGSDDQQVTLWQLDASDDIEEYRRRARRMASRELTETERRKYLPVG